MKKSLLLSLSLLMLTQLSRAQQSRKASVFPAIEDCSTYLRTDKSFYLAGEIIWFKAHLLDSAKKPLDHDQLLLVDLVNSEKSVIEQQILTQNGSASGSVYLPLFLQQGRYRLRAYLPGQDPNQSCAFKADLPLVNTFEKQPANAPKMGTWKAKAFAEADILVAGQPGTLAIKADDQKGKPINFKAFLIKESDTVERFQSHKFGMASINFTPDTTAGYELWVNHRDSSQKVDFPKILKSGVSFHAEKMTSGYQVVFYNRKADPNKSCVAMIHQGEENIKNQKITLENGTANWEISGEILPEGISRLTVFDANQNLVGERLLFKKPKALLPLTVDLKSPKVDLRSKVQVAVNAPTNTQASISVFRLDSLQQNPGSSILSYLWLQKELKGEIYNPNYYFGENNAERNQAIENLLLTHGWRSFANQEEKHASGWPGHKVRVEVLKVSDDSPVVGQTVFLSVPGDDYQFYVSSTDSNGMAEIIADQLYGSEKILLQLPEYNPKVKFKILPPFSSEIKDFEDGFYLKEQYEQTLKELSLGMQLQNVYHKDERQKLNENEAYDLRFFGKPDVVYELDNYTRFPTMEEVLREYTREVRVRKKGDDFQLRMFYDLQNRFFDKKPLLLIDGIPVSENTLMDFDPLLVEKMEITDNRFLSGDYFHDGIVSFETYKGNAEVEEINPEAFETRYQGLTEARVFYSPNYSSDTLQRTPDYRNTLYWNPAIQFEEGAATLEFFTGDRPGKYLLRVEGIDQQGRANFAETILEVEDQKKSASKN